MMSKEVKSDALIFYIKIDLCTHICVVNM